MEIFENEEVVDQGLGGMLYCVQRRDGAVSPHFQHQSLEIGHLANPGTLDGVVNFANRVENRVYRQYSYRQSGYSFILDRRHVPHSLVHVELD